MKILHTVEFYHPSVGGAQAVVKQLSEHMVKLGHDVTVATTKLPERSKNVVNGVKIAEFDISGNEVRGYEGDVDSYKQFLLENKFDVVMNYAAQQWATDLFFEVIDKVDARKVMVPCGYSGLYLTEYEQYFRKLPSILKKYDATVYLASQYRDIDFARKHKLKNVHVIPNGADEDEFKEIDSAQTAAFRKRHKIDDFMILTVGNHTAAKGHKESIMAFMRSKVSPATLVIVGRSFRGGCSRQCRRWALWLNLISFATKKRILLLELPRNETVTAMKSADIFLFLSNIEASPLVLFEANAAGVPFISSQAGNAEEIAQWTGGGLIASSDEVEENGNIKPSIEDSTRLINMLFQDSDQRFELGRSGRKSWQQHYTWGKITEQYIQLYKGESR